jgi:hypothetical protein
VEQPGGASCRDALFQTAVPININGGLKAIQLDASSVAFQPAEDLRTRCPGPDSSDILGSRWLVAGSIPYRALGSKTLAISLVNPGAFRSDDYSGSWSGSLVLRLALKRATGGTSLTRTYVCGDTPC